MLKRTAYIMRAIELLGNSRCNAIVTHLSLADHVRDLDAGQDDARTPEILEPHHRFDNAFDGPVILLDNVVQVFVFAGP